MKRQRRGRRLHRQLVPLRAGEPACSEAKVAKSPALAVAALQSRSRLRPPAGRESRSWVRAAFRPAMAASKPSPKNFPPGWPSAGTTSPSIAASGTCRAVYRGVHLIYLPTLRHKYFDTIFHTGFRPCTCWFTGRMSCCTAMPPTRCSRWPRSRDAGGAERGRSGAQSEEMEPRWRSSGT